MYVCLLVIVYVCVCIYAGFACFCMPFGVSINV